MKSPSGLLFLSLAASVLSTASCATTFDHACLPVEVFATGNRMHVKCAHPEPHFSDRTSPSHWVVYFAAPVNDPLADRFVSIASSALVTGKWLKVFYEGSSDTSFGCLAHDCRRLTSVLLVPYALTPVPLPAGEPVE
jgi:hypothetical protein